VQWENQFRLQVRYPDSPTGYDGIMHVASDDAQDPDVILSIYSIFVLRQLYGAAFPKIDCSQSGWGVHSGPSCAWVFGWSKFLQAAIQNKPVYDDTPSPGAVPSVHIDIEVPIPPVQGEDDEGAVAASLWDIIDTGAEPWDSISLDVKKIWDIVKYFQPQNVCSFSSQWAAAKYSAQLGPILDHHGIVCVGGTPKNLGRPDCPNALCGNPINAATGNKLQVETDFVGAPQTQLELRRSDNSQDSTAEKRGFDIFDIRARNLGSGDHWNRKLT